MVNNLLERCFFYNDERVFRARDVAELFNAKYAPMMYHFEKKPEKFIHGLDYYRLTGRNLAEYKRRLRETGLKTNKAPHYVLFTINGMLKLAGCIRTEESLEFLVHMKQELP